MRQTGDSKSNSADEMISVGIDIGTTTTHLSISRLKLQNIASATQVPRLSVLDREIIYKSQIYRTPLDSTLAIDADAIARILEKEYALAGFGAEEIQTGAVIVTGETARIRNAKQISLAISEMAGDFVVASAGANLEGLFAGRGSGAEAASRNSNSTICNIDIGGGTTNFSVFRAGELIDSACLEVGGRCVQFDQTGTIVSISEYGEAFLEGVAKLHLLPIGSKPDKDLLKLVSNLFAELVTQTVSGKKAPQIVRRLMQADPLRLDYQIDELWFSGGVAECMRSLESRANLESPANLASSANLESIANTLEFDDMGILFAEALKATLEEKSLNYKIAEPGIRSTVIGAAMYSVQLSGCTIMVSDEVLPLKNVSIISPFCSSDATLSEDELFSKLDASLNEFKGYRDNMPLAIAICDISKSTYAGIQVWARVLLKAHQKYILPDPLIVLSKADIGLALGQTIKQYAPEIEQVILDNVDTSTGDLIDIGTKLPQQESVPLLVKTLIF